MQARLPALTPWRSAGVRRWRTPACLRCGRGLGRSGRFPSPGGEAAVVAGGVQGEFGTAEDAAAATFATDTAVIDALEAHVAHSDTLLVLDDLQWADGASFRLLKRVAAEIRRLPLLVIATHAIRLMWRCRTCSPALY